MENLLGVVVLFSLLAIVTGLGMFAIHPMVWFTLPLSIHILIGASTVVTTILLIAIVKEWMTAK